MDIDNNSLSFYNLKKYEDHLNESNKNVNNIKLNDCSSVNKKNQKGKNNTEVNGISHKNNINNSDQSFVSFSDESSYLSSFCKNEMFEDNPDPLNGPNKVINNFPCNSDNSDNSLSEYAYYKEQKENYINNILNENNCNCYENKDYLQLIKTPEKKTHTTNSLEKKNGKKLLSFNKIINSAFFAQEKNEVIKSTSNINSMKENINVENKNSACNDENNNNNNNISNDIISNCNEHYDNNNNVDKEEDLFSVISGSEDDIDISSTLNNDSCDKKKKVKNKKKNKKHSSSKTYISKELKNKLKELMIGNFWISSDKHNLNDESECINNNKDMKNEKKSVPNNFIVKKDKTKEIDFAIKNNYEFKEIITSTVNMCYPKIKNGSDSQDLLNNMEKLSKIVISDDKEKEILNNEEVENTNSLYGEVDNILYNRNKIYSKEVNEFLLKRNEIINADKLNKEKMENNTNKINNENLDNIKKKSEKIKGIVENAETENNSEKLDNFIYYLNHHMVELNENIYKLYNGTCDYTQRNCCTKNIINIVPHLNNIYENKNLCYIKDSPNFNEISKVIPEWKDSFESLNEKALKDTEDMKSILHRIENIKNDLDELNKDLKEDKKEFEKIKFETVEHESMISTFEKKSKIHIKGVLKLDNMSFKLKKIHNIPSNNLNNFTISEHVNRLLKCIDNSSIDYSQNYNEKTFEVLRFQNIDNKFDILTNTDEESCFIMNILNEELKEMILEKKEKLQKIIRKTQLYNILDANTYKEHIGNTLNKHSILINQIKNNVQSKVISLFDIYEKYFKKNMKIIKISDIYVNDYINENVKKSYIIKSFNDTKKNVEKYFMSINFTRNKPIDHPFFIYHCLSEKFVYHFITFVLDPLSEQNQKNFMQYCSIPGFNSFLFSQQVIKLYRQEEQFTKSDISYDFSSAYSRIMCSDLYDFSQKQMHINTNEKWNDENKYLIALRNASDDFFKSMTPKNKFNNYFSLNSSNGFNLIQHIPDSITHMCNNYAAICYDNYNNPGAVLGITKNEDINKLNCLSSFLNTSTSNTNDIFNNSTSNNLFNLNKNSIFTNNTSNNLFNTNNSTNNNNILNNTSNLCSNNNLSVNATNNLFSNATSNLFSNNNTSNLLNSNTNNLFNQSKGNIFTTNNTANNLFNTNTTTTTNNALNSTSNLFGNNTSSNLFTKNLSTNTPNNFFSNTTNNLFSNNNSNNSNLFNNNSTTANISNNIQNNSIPISNNNLFNKSSTTNFFSGSSNNNTDGYFNKNTLSVSNSLFNNNKPMNTTTNNIFSSFNAQPSTKPNNFANNNIFSTNLSNNNSSSFKTGVLSSTSGGNSFMNNNLFSSTKDMNKPSNNFFYSNNNNNNSMNASNINNSIYGAKYNCDNSNNNNSLFNINNNNNNINNNNIFSNQAANFSGNNNYNNLLSNNNSYSLNSNANIFSNNTVSSSNPNNLSKNNLFNITPNNLTNNTNNIFSNNTSNNLFNNTNSMSTNNLFNQNPGITNNSVNNLSCNSNNLFNSKNNVLSINNNNNNNNFNSNTSMLNNNLFSSNNNSISQNNNLFTNSLNNKQNNIFSKDNKNTNNLFENRLFQNQDNNFISNSNIDINGKNSFGVSTNLSNNNLFQKNSFSVTQNKGGMPNFNSSSLSNNFNVLNNINPFQKKNEPNFPSFFNSTNNALFSR